VIPGDNGLPAFDPSVPPPARMWNYWLGGKDNFAADRVAAERVLEVMPTMPLIARAARLFLVEAVQRLAGEHGVRQFLDIGIGLPVADNTHQIAQRVAPESRIVYVDYDPIVRCKSSRSTRSSTLPGPGTWPAVRPGGSATCRMRKRAAAWACRPGELSGQLGDSSPGPNGGLCPRRSCRCRCALGYRRPAR
jgi:hypothetical protein